MQFKFKAHVWRKKVIPKIIHYCWFGGAPLPESVKNCIKTWELLCPDYEVKCWNEQNWDINQNIYVKQAYELKKYAFVSDFVRLDVVQKYGGVYLDTDVELVKPLDSLLTYDSFFGVEEIGKVNTGLGFGACKESEIVDKLRQLYVDRKFVVGGVPTLETCVDLASPIFKQLGLKSVDKVQFFEKQNLVVFPPQYLCPEDFLTGKIVLTDKTISIHHYDASWKSNSKIERGLTKFKIRFHRIVDETLGEGTYRAIKLAFLNLERSFKGKL